MAVFAILRHILSPYSNQKTTCASSISAVRENRSPWNHQRFLADTNISKKSHFLLSPDSFSLHQLNQQTTWQKSYYINRHLPQDPPVFGWQNVHIEHTEPLKFAGPCQDMGLLSCRTGINETESFPWLAPCKKETIAHEPTCHFLPR